MCDYSLTEATTQFKFKPKKLEDFPEIMRQKVKSKFLRI